MCVVTASDEAQRDLDTELASSVHQVLAILTDLRSDVRADELSNRLALVRWLRQELTEVETLLTGAHRRRTAGPAPASGVTG